MLSLLAKSCPGDVISYFKNVRSLSRMVIDEKQIGKSAEREIRGYLEQRR